MKRVAILLIGAFFVLAGIGSGLSQEKAKSPKPSASAQAKVSKKKGTKQEAHSKLGEYRMGGVVTKIDSTGMKITIKQSKVKGERTASLKVDKALSKQLPTIKQGDVVNVWVQGKKIKELKKIE